MRNHDTRTSAAWRVVAAGWVIALVGSIVVATVLTRGLLLVAVGAIIMAGWLLDLATGLVLGRRMVHPDHGWGSYLHAVFELVMMNVSFALFGVGGFGVWPDFRGAGDNLEEVLDGAE